MAAKKSATKTVQLLKIPGVKLGTKCLYYQRDGQLSIGAGEKRTTFDADRLNDLFSKSECRKIRKALHKFDLVSLAANSVPQKQQSIRKMMEYAEYRERQIRRHTKQRYAEANYGDENR